MEKAVSISEGNLRLNHDGRRGVEVKLDPGDFETLECFQVCVYDNEFINMNAADQIFKGFERDLVAQANKAR